jgi:tetratricopeptide (TPR) repeat protein
VLNQKEQNESAVECYTQALKINEKHLPSIFNLACNLEKLKRYEKAKHWFEHAIKVKPSWPDALYGLTLVCIKLK